MDRHATIERLRGERFDLLVVGGGASGAGIALDAASRGLATALVERDDFAAGTSSRSTKLIHGGVRYLERAVLEMDRAQYALVRDALRERSILLRIAPHLARWLAILTPVYGRLEVPYYLAGLKAYDWLAGGSDGHSSRYLPPLAARRRFPLLRAEGLRGAVLYHDGQFDDARMNVALAVTAAERGAAVANHVEVTALLKAGGAIQGARVRDALDGAEFEVGARVVVNATGPFADGLRRLDDPATPAMLSASSGAHVVVDGRFSPPDTGMLIPKTEDGRVLFVLPWLGHTLIGTTDNPAAVETHPLASQDDVTYILRQLERYVARPIGRGDVRATWSGLRPLVSAPAGTRGGSTAKLSRDHVIETSRSGLVTIAGGKWTTYRRMAEDAVDAAVAAGRLAPAGPSRTEAIPLAGGEGFEPGAAAALESDLGLERDVARHLHRAYGSRAPAVAALRREVGPARLAAGHPFLDAEVLHAARAEGACRLVDVLARRLRLAFLDRAAVLDAAPRAEAILAAELGWSAERRAHERARLAAWLGP